MLRSRIERTYSIVRMGALLCKSICVRLQEDRLISVGFLIWPVGRQLRNRQKKEKKNHADKIVKIC
jgi:hypothetical protein